MTTLDKNLRFLLIIALLIPKNIKEQQSGEVKVVFHSNYSGKETAFKKSIIYHSLIVQIGHY